MGYRGQLAIEGTTGLPLVQVTSCSTAYRPKTLDVLSGECMRELYTFSSRGMKAFRMDICCEILHMHIHHVSGRDLLLSCSQ